MKKKIEEILGVYWVSPHAPPPEAEWKNPPCGDCFCGIQRVHSHSRNQEFVYPLMKLFKEYFTK